MMWMLLALAAPLPKEMTPKDGLLALWNAGKPLLLRPDGRVYRDLSHAEYGKEGVVAVSPDGKKAALVSFGRTHRLFVRGIDEKGPGDELDLDGLQVRHSLHWSHERWRLRLAGFSVRDKDIEFDVAAKKRSDLPIPRDRQVIGERPGGDFLVSGHSGGEPRWAWLSPDGKRERPLEIDLERRMMGNDHLSADGKRVLSVIADNERRCNRLLVTDLETGKKTELATEGLPEKEFVIERARWSPDGKRVAFYWMATIMDEKEPWYRWARKSEASLVVSDADGKKAKVVRKGRAEAFHYFNWR